MKYMVDAMLCGLAKELQDNEIDCETVMKVMRGDEDSRTGIPDPDILEFLMKANGTITLITMDTELARYCEKFHIPHIRIQDLVIDFINNIDIRIDPNVRNKS